MGLHERLAQARAQGDMAEVHAVIAEARARLAALDAEVARRFAEDRGGPEELGAIGRCLAEARELEKLTAEALVVAAGPRH